MEVVKTKQTRLFGRILFLVAVVLLMAMCQFANAQNINRIEFQDGDNILIKRYNSKSLSFKNPLIGDNIEMNVYSDSIDNKTITFALYVIYPKNINAKNNSILIQYVDGTQDMLLQTRYDDKDGYAEYEPTVSINNLLFKKVDFLLIRGVSKYDKFDKTYFKDFLASIY